MSVITLDTTNFESEVIKSAEPVLVDFWAPWCGPCRMQGPIIEELGNELQGKSVKVAKLNVDEAREIASNYQVMSIPTLIIFKDGKPYEQMVGVQEKETLKNKLEALA